MKTATLPPIRLEPKLKKQLEAALEPGETLSAFVLESAVKTAEVRKAQRAFIQRALARERRAERTGRYVPAERVYKRLERILEKARAKRPRAAK